MNRSEQVSRKRFDEIYEQSIAHAKLLEEQSYYDFSRERYWISLKYFADMDIPRGGQILEVGGGQLAILASQMFGDRFVVADISSDYRTVIDESGIEFVECNLMQDDPSALYNRFDAIVMLEVIEHLPTPGYVILSKLHNWLKKDGLLLLTTPNLFRLRNLARMIAGKDIFDTFELPRPGVGLGHQLEYSAPHLRFQLERGGFEPIFVKHDQLGQAGFSLKARVARQLLSPLRLRPKWREELVAVARRKDASA